MSRLGRSDPCPCGSGRKYKQCCLKHDEPHVASQHTETISTSRAIQIALEQHRARQLHQAEAIYQQILKVEPNHPDALHFLGVIAYQVGNNDIAADLIGRAIRINPSGAMYSNLGLVFQALGKLDSAVDQYRMAIACQPDYAEAHNNLGNALKDQGNLVEAVKHYRMAIFRNPDFAVALNNLGFAFKEQGLLNEAVEYYEKALSTRPNFSEAYSNLLFLHAYHSLLDPLKYLSLACGWEKSCVPACDRQLARGRIFRRPPIAGRRLRVGYVSGDYRRHAVSYFIEQLFAHHDRTRVELFAYSASAIRDEVTGRLQAMVDHWIPVVGVSDTTVLDRIETDGIDVLIDLSGHTMHDRLGVFARRAAPVQAHYLGYFASTGLTEMDYFIGDGMLTPPETDGHFSEQVWRLPGIRASYEGKADAPLPDWHPASDGSVWLGSFNNLGKLTPATLSLWAKVLHAMPQGRLLLKTKELADDGNRRRILDAMAGYGVVPDRIELRDSSATPGWSEHMAYYNRLDIALDPVGAHGGYTTSCDALWMGVPVITLEGDRMATRMTSSILDAIGHPEWIARSEAEYVDKVVALARDAELRKALRSGQRERMAASPLCDAKNLAVSLENACFEMFERWLEKQHERASGARAIS